MNILLTSCGRRVYLVKYFREALKECGGGKVFCVNSDPVTPCANVCDAFFEAPEIYSGRYAEFLLELCGREKIDAVLPLFDLDIPVLADEAERFSSRGVRLIVPSPAAARLVSDKYLLGETLEKAGISVPETARSLEEALAMVESGSLSYPLVVKPRRGTGSIGTFIAKAAEELKFFASYTEKKIAESYLRYEAELLPAGERAVIQQFIPGEEYGIDCVCDLGGNYAGTLVRRKLRMRSGETDACVTVSDERLEEIGRRLTEALKPFGGHVGCLDADVIVSGGKYYVIDANARFGGGYPFSHNAGANLPLAIVKWLKGEEADRLLIAQRPGVIGAKAPEIYRIG